MQVPTARRLLDQIVEDLRLGRSVLVLLPEGVSPSLLRPALWDGLRYWDLHVEEVFISQLDAQQPVAALGQALGVDWKPARTPRTVENLLRQTGLPEVLFLDGFDDLAEEDRGRWLRFLVQWARISQGENPNERDGRSLPPALWLLARGSRVPYPLPDTNVLLSVRVWWGLPTVLEMRLLCQLASTESNDPLNRLKEHTIPSIAGPDLELGGYLWGQRHLSGEQLAHALRAFGQERGWTQEELETWPMSCPVGDGEYPLEDWPVAFYRAWARGMVHLTPEHGIERHSAVLALLNRQEALTHRLWRGQAEFLLSKIDEVRLGLCGRLSQEFGDDWAYRWREPETDRELRDVRETPFACQWGHLRHLLKSCPELQRERRWYSLVDCSWRIRTELAHYRPISEREYEKFYWELRRSHQAGLKTGL